MVHVVKVVNIVRALMTQLQRWCLRLTLNLESDEPRCFNYRDELGSAV